MLQAPSATSSLPTGVQCPAESNTTAHNTAECFKRMASELKNESHASLAARGRYFDSERLASLNLLQKNLQVEDRGHGFHVAHEALSPVVAEGSDEMRDIYQDITNKMSQRALLEGSALDNLDADIFFLFLKLLALINKQQEQDKLSRKYERELQTKYMYNVADNFDTQGRWLLNTCIGSGVLSILSGICPILQTSQTGGSLFGFLKDKFSIGDGLKQEDFFKSIQKMTWAGSEISKNSGQVQSTYSEGWRTIDHHKSDVAKMLNEDETRNLEDARQYFNNIQNAMQQKMQQERDLENQLAR